MSTSQAKPSHLLRWKVDQETTYKHFFPVVTKRSQSQGSGKQSLGSSRWTKAFQAEMARLTSERSPSSSWVISILYSWAAFHQQALNCTSQSLASSASKYYGAGEAHLAAGVVKKGARQSLRPGMAYSDCSSASSTGEHTSVKSDLRIYITAL